MRTAVQRVNRWRRELAGDSHAADAHPLDLVIALLSRGAKVFSRGWGDEAFLAALSSQVSHTDPPCAISVSWSPVRERGRAVRRDGIFPSPLPMLPDKAGTGHVRAWQRAGNHDACVILAGSNDQGYLVRERVFGSLTQQGLDLYLLENPFYGRRRTAGGLPAMTVSDQGALALGMVLEARALLTCLSPHYERLAVAGYSMGGHMAAITAAVSPFPVACAAMAAGASASSIYTRGLLSWSVDYDGLGGGATQSAAARERLGLFFDAADVTHYSCPIRTDAAVILGCMRDGYVMRSETERLHRHWPGSTLRWLDAGHFSALLTGRRVLCECIIDAIERL